VFFGVLCGRGVSCAVARLALTCLIVTFALPATPALALSLGPPRAVTAKAVSHTEISVSWSAGNGAIGYQVMRSKSSGGPYAMVGTTSSLQYSDRNLTSSTTYYYVVLSTAGTQVSRPSREAGATTAISPPLVVRATGAANSITVEWEPVAGAASYAVVRGGDGGGFITVGSTTGTSFMDVTATGGFQYVYRVRSVTATSSSESHDVWARAGAATSVQLTVSPTRSELGQHVLLTARVTPADPATPIYMGDVGFYVDGLVIGHSQVDPSMRFAEAHIGLPVGEHVFYAQYAGDQSTGLGASASVSIRHTAVAGYGQVSYGPYRAYWYGQVEPSTVAVADVTGDGRGDLLMSTTDFATLPEDNCRLLIWDQRPDGTLAEPRILTTHGMPNGTMILGTGDLDGDGDTDVALTADHGVDILLQEAGGLAAPIFVPIGDPLEPTIYFTDLLLADMKADGRADLILSELNIPTVRLSVDGRSFAPPVVVSPSLTGGPLDTGDLNGDGRKDIVRITSNIMQMQIYTQTAAGTFEEAALYPIPHGYARGAGDVGVGDLTGDGRADVALTVGGNDPSSRILVFPQQPTGLLGPPIAYPVLDIPEPIALADVNADGLLDAVTVHGGWQAAGVALQRPDGILGRHRLYYLPYATHYYPRGLAVGDLTGDNRPEIVIADYNNGVVVLPQA